MEIISLLSITRNSPFLRNIFTLKSHLESHTDSKAMINGLQELVHTDNELTSPDISIELIFRMN